MMMRCEIMWRRLREYFFRVWHLLVGVFCSQKVETRRIKMHFFQTSAGGRHRISANFFPVISQKSWPKSVNFFFTASPKNRKYHLQKWCSFIRLSYLRLKFFVYQKAYLSIKLRQKVGKLYAKVVLDYGSRKVSPWLSLKSQVSSLSTALKKKLTDFGQLFGV